MSELSQNVNNYQSATKLLSQCGRVLWCLCVCVWCSTNCLPCGLHLVLWPSVCNLHCGVDGMLSHSCRFRTSGAPGSFMYLLGISAMRHIKFNFFWGGCCLACNWIEPITGHVPRLLTSSHHQQLPRTFHYSCHNTGRKYKNKNQGCYKHKHRDISIYS